MREAIHIFKYNRNLYTGEKLAKFAVLAFVKKFEPADFDVIIPVPLHTSRLRWREFNQAVVIAKAISREYNIPIDYDLIIRSRKTKPQTELTQKQREKNIRGAFKMKPGLLSRILPNWSISKKFRKEKRPTKVLQGKRFLLVDDVITTGLTTDECARVLKRHGASFVGGVTVARATF